MLLMTSKSPTMHVQETRLSLYLPDRIVNCHWKLGPASTSSHARVVVIMQPQLGWILLDPPASIQAYNPAVEHSTR